MTSFESIKRLAQDKAMEAIHQRMPDAARKWTEVAAVADAASRGQTRLIDPLVLGREWHEAFSADD